MTVEQLLEAEERSYGRPCTIFDSAYLGEGKDQVAVILYRPEPLGPISGGWLEGRTMIETRWAVATSTATVHTSGTVRTEMKETEDAQGS